jgi:raffinose/stachyose/melibiose transport system substrate-binding protein
MSRTIAARIVTALGVSALASGALVACSTGSADGTVEITYAVQNDPIGIANAEKYVAAFMEANPDITVTINSQPPGTEGDNITKTKLSTGEMEDVFFYNSGSLLQALNPDETLADLSEESWLDVVNDDFISTVKTDNGIYGAPQGTSFGGGVIYNIPLYEELGLEVPTSWADFLANSEKIKAERPDVAPVVQAYGETWTSQLFVLADFANVATADPDWAENYTANKAKFVDEPALAGFEHQQEAFEAGLFNEDFASLTNEQAVAMIAEGTGAQYPILTNTVNIIDQNFPDKINDVGYFALPADDAANTAATVWQPNALYIPKSTEGEELAAAKKFVAFMVESDEACEIAKSTGLPAGPFVTTACVLEGDVPRMVQDLQGYFESGKTAPALEYLSPVKGPNLENIAIEVGSGIRSAQEGAAAYDEDVKKQAQQLGLEGW